MNIKPIPSFPGYFASECGKIFSDKNFHGNRRKDGQVHEIKGSVREGYIYVGIRNESGERKRLSVHRLIAIVWCSGYNPQLTVNHKDSNKTNNHSSNLEWVTVGENIRHSVLAGKRVFKWSGTGFGRPIWRTNRDGSDKKIYPSLSEGSRDIGVNPKRGAPNIHSALNGRMVTAYGFKWGYVSAEAEGKG